jgi:hypothetical protein
MLLKEKYSQLFIEFEGTIVHIDIHLPRFDRKNVSTVLGSYIEKYRGKKVHHLSLKCWEKNIAGDYLNMLRKNTSESFLLEPLNGFRFIKAVYNYLSTDAEVGEVTHVY